jgi:hypothetical protein
MTWPPLAPSIIFTVNFSRFGSYGTITAGTLERKPPYLEVALPLNSGGALAIRRTIVGPSPNANLSFDALSRYLSKAGVRPSEVHNSGIPYRQT